MALVSRSILNLCGHHGIPHNLEVLVDPKTRKYVPGMRSKWSEDEEDNVKITTGKDNENGKAPGKNIKSDSQDFPYPNAVDSKDGNKLRF